MVTFKVKQFSFAAVDAWMGLVVVRKACLVFLGDARLTYLGALTMPILLALRQPIPVRFAVEALARLTLSLPGLTDNSPWKVAHEFRLRARIACLLLYWSPASLTNISLETHLALRTAFALSFVSERKGVKSPHLFAIAAGLSISQIVCQSVHTTW